jgi:hypothetical protein
MVKWSEGNYITIHKFDNSSISNVVFVLSQTQFQE